MRPIAMKTFFFSLLKLLATCVLVAGFGIAHAASGSTGKEFYFLSSRITPLADRLPCL
jgi:hypothetical protein